MHRAYQAVCRSAASRRLKRPAFRASPIPIATSLRPSGGRSPRMKRPTCKATACMLNCAGSNGTPTSQPTARSTRQTVTLGRCLAHGGLESALRPLGHELAFHWSAVQGQPRRLLAMRFGLPQPVGRSADVLSGGVQRVAGMVSFLLK